MEPNEKNSLCLNIVHSIRMKLIFFENCIIYIKFLNIVKI